MIRIGIGVDKHKFNIPLDKPKKRKKRVKGLKVANGSKAKGLAEASNKL